MAAVWVSGIHMLHVNSIPFWDMNTRYSQSTSMSPAIVLSDAADKIASNSTLRFIVS